MNTSDYHFISKPNRSLSAQSRTTLLYLLAIIPVLIGIYFTYLGLWLVFPFVGIELFALAFAFNYLTVHDNDFESITIDESKIIVVKQIYKNTLEYELSTNWVQIQIDKKPRGKLKLLLRSHGQSVEFGDHMNSQQCIDYAVQLKKIISSIKNKI